jgi:hypothetical protein
MSKQNNRKRTNPHRIIYSQDNSNETLYASIVNDTAEQNKMNLLEVYKLCVEEARENSKNRNDANNRFVTILVALIAGMIGMSQFIVDYAYTLAVVALVIAISLIWILHISVYKRINSAKFNVIEMIEEKLNLGLKPFQEEWKMLKPKKTYLGVSNSETILAVVFIVVSIVVGLICVIKKYT